MTTRYTVTVATTAGARTYHAANREEREALMDEAAKNYGGAPLEPMCGTRGTAADVTCVRSEPTHN